MKVVIAGSRTISDIVLVVDAIKDSGYNITEVVSGTAQGVDRLGETWTKQVNKMLPDTMQISLKKFPADWDKYGKAAGPIRNKQMAEYADAAIVIHNGSKGSLNMIAQMKKLGKPVYEKVVE